MKGLIGFVLRLCEGDPACEVEGRRQSLAARPPPKSGLAVPRSLRPCKSGNLPRCLMSATTIATLTKLCVEKDESELGRKGPESWEGLHGKFFLMSEASRSELTAISSKHSGSVMAW